MSVGNWGSGRSRHYCTIDVCRSRSCTPRPRNAWVGLTAPQYVASREMLNELWGAVDVVELDADLMLSAADVALPDGAFVGTTPSTVRLRPGFVVRDVVAAATGDTQLLAAWSAEG